jgi:predicted methyltransferase
MTSKQILAAGVAAALTFGALAAAPAWAEPDANIMAAVADNGRPEADTKRDADRKPAEMLAFAGVKPGQVVVDYLPGGGYFTRIFSKAVGSKGVVYALSAPVRAPADPAKPSPPPAPDLIAADPAYANVKSIHAPLGAFPVPQKADLIWTSLNYHDLHSSVRKVDVAALNRHVFEALKPGGHYVVVDHAAAAGAGLETADTLHRIDPAIVRREVEAAGFKLVDKSDVLMNAADDHTLPLRKVERGHTDQFMLKFQKSK